MTVPAGATAEAPSPAVRTDLIISCPQGHVTRIEATDLTLHSNPDRLNLPDVVRDCAEVGLAIRLGYTAERVETSEAVRRFTETYGSNNCPDCDRLSSAYRHLDILMTETLAKNPNLNSEPEPAHNEITLDSDLLELLRNLAGEHPNYDLQDLRQALSGGKLLRLSVRP